MAFAHVRKIIHRDLKPANILVVNGEGSSAHLKIADFGIGAITAEAAGRAARHTGLASTRTAASAYGGYSLYYASPEQARGTAKADPRDDVHAIGVIWFQLLVGDLTAEAPRGPGWKKRFAAKGMPAGMIEFLESCTASEREDRPASAVEVAVELGLLLSEAPAAREVGSNVSQKPTLGPSKAPAVLSPEALDQVADSVASQMRELSEVRRRNRFLTGLASIVETLRRMTATFTWTKKSIFLFLVAFSFILVLAGGVGTTVGVVGYHFFYRAVGLQIVLGLGSGFMTLVLLWFARGWLWRRKLPRMNRSVDEIVAQLRTEYPVEMARFGDIDFHDAEAVAKMMTEFERHLTHSRQSEPDA